MNVKILTAKKIGTLLDRVLTEVRELDNRWPRQRGIVIVPEYRKLLVERYYLEQEGTGNLMMSEVLSFNRLTYRLLDCLGLPDGDFLHPEGSAMLLRNILYRKKDDLRYFGILRQNRHHLQEIEGIIGELTRFGIHPDVLEELEPPLQTTADKLYDTALIMRERSRIMHERRLLDQQTASELLLEQLAVYFDGAGEPREQYMQEADNPLLWLTDAQVWVTGFAEERNFTPLEQRMLARLADICSSLTVTIIGENLEQIAYPGSLAEQRAGYRTLQSLKQLFPHLSLEIISEHEQKPEAYLIEAEDTRTALHWVAGKFQSLSLEGKRFRDLAAVCTDSAEFGSGLKEVCAEAAVPIFIEDEKTLLHAPAGRLLSGALDLCFAGFTLSNVMYFLRSGLLPVSDNTLDSFENFCLAKGLERSYLFNDEFYAIENTDGEQNISPNLELRQKYLEPVLRLQASLKRKANCAEHCAALVDFLAALQVEQEVESQVAALQAADQTDDALMVAQSWNGVHELIHQLVLVCGSQEMQLKELRQIILSGLDHLVAAVIPTAINQVTAGTPERILGSKPKVLMILGAEEGLFPSPSFEEGLLKDSERAFLSQSLGLDFPSIYRSKPVTDAFMIEQLLLLPSEEIYFITRKDKRVAGVCHRAVAADRVIQVEAEINDPQDVRLFSATTARRRLFSLGEQDDFSETENFAAWAEVAARCRSTDPSAYDSALKKLENEFVIGQRKINIGAEPISQLFQGRVESGITALEQYAGCPYSYFVERILGVHEQEVLEVDYMRFGSFLHAVLEYAYQDLLDKSMSPDELLSDREKYDAWLSKLYDSLIEDSKFSSVFGRPEYSASAGRRAFHIAYSTIKGQVAQNRAEQRRPVALEWAFGRPTGNPLLIRLPALTASLRGVLDRVDESTQTGQEFYVVDYKSGQKKVDDERLWYGLDLQLPLYLKAWQNEHPTEQPKGAAYVNLLGTKVNGKPTAEAAEYASKIKVHSSTIKLDERGLKLLMEHAMGCAKNSLDKISRGEFEVTPVLTSRNPQSPCRYCQAKGACGIEGTANHRQLPALENVPVKNGDNDKKSAEQENNTVKTSLLMTLLESTSEGAES